MASQAELNDLDRQRKGPENGDFLAAVGDDHHAFAGIGHDLLAQQRRAAALDQPKFRIEFVGAVDRQIEFRGLVQRGQRDAGMFGEAARRLRGRDADHVETRLHPHAQEFDEMGGGRAGAEAEPHSGTDEFERGLRGRALLMVAHEFSPPSITYFISVNSSIP